MTRVETTVLFTDIVGSTALAVSLGDRPWAELLGRHHAVVREHLACFDGVEMDTAGDGFFATFDDPSTAVECVREVAQALQPLGIRIRAGLHAGDCIVVGTKCTGLAVHIGARLTALAAPGQAIASEAVRRSAPGAVDFVDRGVVELRDVPGTWQIYAIELMGERPDPQV